MNTVRAWKDPEYRAELSEADLASLAGNPAGAVELSDDDLDGVSAAGTTWACVTASVAVSIAWCAPDGAPWGSCHIGTRGCG